MWASRRACASSSGVSRARASRKSAAASSTARPARFFRLVITDASPMAPPAATHCTRRAEPAAARSGADGRALGQLDAERGAGAGALEELDSASAIPSDLLADEEAKPA